MALVVFLAAAHSVAFLAAAQVGANLEPLVCAYVVAAGLLFGLRGGLLTALFAVGHNTLLFYLAGLPASDRVFTTRQATAAVILLIVGGVVGWIRDLSLALQQEIAQRKQAEQQKAELTALIVHDLKSPLTAILGGLDFMAESAKEAVVRELSQKMLVSAQTMQRMVMDMLDVARAEEGALRPKPAEIDLVALVEQVRQSLSQRLESNELSVSVSAPEGTRHVTADRELLRRVVENLLDNAIKYSPRRGAIQVEIAPSEPGFIELRVQDEGPGLPPEFRERIFEKYVRLESEGEDLVRQGHGLGLVFCRLAAEAHGGKIWVDSRQPSGSTFRVQIPGPAVGPLGRSTQARA